MITTTFDGLLSLHWDYPDGCTFTPSLYLPAPVSRDLDIVDIVCEPYWLNLLPSFADVCGVSPMRLQRAADVANQLIIEVDRVIGAIEPARIFDVCEMFERGDWSGLPMGQFGHREGELDHEKVLVFWKSQLLINQQRHTGKTIKQAAIRSRRQDFQKIRNDILLALLDSGIPYQCCIPSCGISEDLTLDHKIPLSRGGTDDLSNFQFMCRSHNSAKGDRTQEAQ